MIYYNDVIFSKEECAELLNSAHSFKESTLGITYNSELYDMVANTNKRKSTQCELSATPETFIYQRINQIINTFDYKLVCDVFHYDIIKYNKGDFIWRHKDDNGERMFSIVIQLSESDSYEGGEFKYWVGETEFEMSRDIGVGMAFKAGVFHEVKPVIANERNSFVSFVKFSDVKKIGKAAII